MRHLTRKAHLIAQAESRIAAAHAERDLAAYTAAHQAKQEAEAMEEQYECASCGKEWAGDGRLIICYVSVVDVDPTSKWLQEHERGNEHHLAFCPNCKEKIKQYVVKR